MRNPVQERQADILETLNIQLSSEQSDIFWDDSRLIVAAAGEGAGKSFLGALFAISLGVARGDHLVWFVGKDFEDARTEIGFMFGESDETMSFATDLGLLDRDSSTISAHMDQPVVLRLRHEKSGLDLIMKTVSAYDPLKIGREQPDIIIGCEISRWMKEVWDRCYGRLARKYPYSRGFFSGSPEDVTYHAGWFPEICAVGSRPNDLDIKAFSLPSWANPRIYPGGAEDPAITQLQASMPPERFLSRHAGKFSPPRDAVFPEFKATLHIQPVERDADTKMYVAIDPGGGGGVYAVEFIQVVKGEVHVVNEVFLYQASHEQVMQECMLKPEWKYVREGTIDVLGGSQHHGGMGSPEEAWRRDTGIILRSQYVKIEMGIERLRSVLAINPATQLPRLLVNPRCKGFIGEMGGGRAPVPKSGLWRMDHGRPRTDNCDAAKAIYYWLVTHYGTVRPYTQDYMEEGDDPGVYSYLSAPASTFDRIRSEMYPKNENQERVSIWSFERG